MQERQARMQKRVRYEDGQHGTAYVSADESDEGRAGEEDGAGQGGAAGASDFGMGPKKAPEEFDDYVDRIKGDQNKSSSFELFTQKRRKQVYEKLNPIEEERFNAFIEACPKKPMKKKLVELMLQLPGPKLKIHEDVIQVITSAVKSHAG
mmetsp:Transcript_24629/g.30702  ORF Transcript_24629/g.30702 Transcript_24629/m.30702 type:complete len:150 (-) Transcript_24629:4233-4682(-)